ncbi:MAG: GNAT family N-acetyltransferase [Gammaproteobacteria bacterium RIFCSPHIGHO2_12_FULL_37_14]|nr:MAG: GNAT family N-acetyltransferase [Gammaproteobacteria bacterium RIFCSPHIGHO2_12_FULL_37_14]
MSIFLETKRLIINTPESIDFDNLYALQLDADVMQYIGQGVRTPTEVRSGLEKAIAHQKKYGFSLGCVFERESGVFVGRAGLIYLAYEDTQPDIEVAYALTKAAWCKGYATELASALIDWGFQHLPVTKFVAVINPRNDRSRRVLEKIKMRYVGRAHYWNSEVALYDIHKPNIDYGKIKLIPATLEEYPVIQNMGRFYVYDMSEYLGSEEGWEIPENGLYECIDFKKYWEDKSNFPFVVKYKNEIVGFVMVDKKGSAAEIDFNMAQFFVLRKFKNKGLGRYIAHLCFKKFAGVWEVMVIPGNEGAYRFWRSIIKDYCGGHFTEYSREIAHFNNSKKNIFTFDSRNTQ